jgi:selenide,water dikinase
VLRHLPPIVDPRVLVGNATNDDAAIYRLSDEQALVATVDYFTPIVDDPYDFGQIAAANALSDIYAMGARPLYALAICGFPRDRLGEGVLERILLGGADKAAEAGIPVVGGHSIDDAEPKYGLSVTGVVHPDRIVRNVGARIGDALVLTKPLGMGIVATAVKRGVASPELVATAVRTMATLNRDGAEAMMAAGPNAATDVTGFGLVGHLGELTTGSGVAARLRFDAVPFLDGVEALTRADVVPGGTRRNHAGVSAFVRWGRLDEVQQLMLADAQTSGGLLIAVPRERAAGLIEDLRRRGTPAAVEIGEIVPGDGWIEVT